MNKNIRFQLKKKCSFEINISSEGGGTAHNALPWLHFWFMVDIAWHRNKWYLRLILLNNASLHTMYKLLPNPKETWKEKEFRSTHLNLGKDAIISLQSKILKHGQTWWVLEYRAYVWRARQSHFPPNNKAAWSNTKHKPKIYRGSVLSSNWFFFFFSIFSSSIFFSGTYEM